MKRFVLAALCLILFTPLFALSPWGCGYIPIAWSKGVVRLRNDNRTASVRAKCRFTESATRSHSIGCRGIFAENRAHFSACRSGVSGATFCAITSEGYFPKVYQSVSLIFKNRSSFLNFEKVVLVYPDDFVSMGDGVVGGTVKTDKATLSAVIDLQFEETYQFKDRVNGQYSLIAPATYIVPQ
jgi:hypothetical protein